MISSKTLTCRDSTSFSIDIKAATRFLHMIPRYHFLSSTKTLNPSVAASLPSSGALQKTMWPHE